MELPMAKLEQSSHQQETKNHTHGPHEHGADGVLVYEQYLGIAVSGIMGLVSLYLFQSGKLNLILAQKFHVWVLISGIGLLFLSGIRAYMALTGFSGGCCSHDHGEDAAQGMDGCSHDHGHDHAHDHDHKGGLDQGHSHGQDLKPSHDHDHSHDHNHSHDHGHHHGHQHKASHEHGHSHDHGHKHKPSHDHGHSHGSGFLPVQTMILLSPIVLLLGLPTEVFNASQALDANQVEASSRDIKDKGEDFGVTFTQLERAAGTAESRSFYEGKTVRLTGRFVGDDDKRFTLIRYKINCCAADAVPLNSVIMVDPKISERIPLQKLRNQWVQVTGKVQFLKKIGKEEHVSSLILTPAEGKTLDSVIEIVPPDANPYVN